MQASRPYDPQETLTTAQFVTLLVGAFDIPLAKNLSNSFVDVSPNAWHYKMVYAAFNAGIIKGTSATTFSPLAKITRRDMAVIINNVWNKYGSQINANNAFINKFNDNMSISEYAKNSVAVANKLGIINGKENSLFDPKGYATRAEAAVVVSKMFNNI